MRKISAFAGLILLTSLVMLSCQKSKTDATSANDISAETIAKIQALGFSTDQVAKVSNGYRVEGDIVLTNELLNKGESSSKDLRIATTEQYRTLTW